MRFHRAAKFSGARGGKGWYVSFITSSGFLLIAFRPGCWRFATLKLQARPGVTRRYLGPLEIETHKIFIQQESE
jgi:hypothetical protein